ncbi:MAG: methyltransferase domain-containing protein [Myxococcales bacterium]|nr:methyltransferase domain-containing protein [Myxococcales bacterium]MBK7198743.1 methyltransferase domain-containing protein [Myxococcales bacterium]
MSWSSPPPPPRAPFDPLQIARDLRDGREVTDAQFERLFPVRLREMSRVHWTPLPIARRVVALLAPTADETMLDVGAGAGKLCLVGALLSAARWVGLELRPALVQAAAVAARQLEVERQVTFTQVDAAAWDWGAVDGVYLYNPFGELLMRADETSLRSVGMLDGAAPYTTRNAYYQQLVDAVAAKAWTLRPGARVVTFHGFGGQWPRCLEQVSTETVATGPLELWVRRGAGGV